MDLDDKIILEVLSPEYFADDHLTTHEMRVFEYLQRHVSTLNVELSKVFLKYVTGMEVLHSEISIKVLFNGEVELENMVPQSNTCSSSLHLLRYFMRYSPIKDILDNILSNRNL